MNVLGYEFMKYHKKDIYLECKPPLILDKAFNVCDFFPLL